MEKEKLIEQHKKEVEKLFKTEENLNENKETTDTDYGSPEWNHFMNAAKHRQYETEEVSMRKFMNRLNVIDKRIEQENKLKKHIFKHNTKRIYDFLKLDFSNVKYILPYLRDKRGLSFDYFVARQSPIIRRMIELINYDFKNKI